MAFAVFKPLYKIRYFVIGFVSIGSVFGLINRASYGSESARLASNYKNPHHGHDEAHH